VLIGRGVPTAQAEVLLTGTRAQIPAPADQDRGLGPRGFSAGGGRDKMARFAYRVKRYVRGRGGGRRDREEAFARLRAFPDLDGGVFNGRFAGFRWAAAWGEHQRDGPVATKGPKAGVSNGPGETLKRGIVSGSTTGHLLPWTESDPQLPRGPAGSVPGSRYRFASTTFRRTTDAQVYGPSFCWRAVRWRRECEARKAVGRRQARRPARPRPWKYGRGRNGLMADPPEAVRPEQKARNKGGPGGRSTTPPPPPPAAGCQGRGGYS